MAQLHLREISQGLYDSVRLYSWLRVVAFGPTRLLARKPAIVFVLVRLYILHHKVHFESSNVKCPLVKQLKRNLLLHQKMFERMPPLWKRPAWPLSPDQRFAKTPHLKPGGTVSPTRNI